MQREVTLRRLTKDGDTITKVKVATLVKEKFDTVPFNTIVNGKSVKNWDELLEEVQKSENPQVLQVPLVVGG